MLRNPVDTLPTLDLLFERDGLPTFDLPEELTRTYGGGFGFERPRLYANFVSSVDGVVALPDDAESGHLISNDSIADRFVMGLLRACADAVLIGAGTFRKTPDHLWNAETIYPPAAPLFADARRRLGASSRPKLVLATASGAVDVTRPALRDALVVTTETGAAALRGLPTTARVLVSGAKSVGLADVIATLHAEGHRLILTEGGPSVVSALASQGLLDELFVTSSPFLFGRFPKDGRKALTDGTDLGRVALELSSARRHESHLFLRYAVR